MQIALNKITFQSEVMETFISLLNDVAPGFICEAAGRKEPKPAPTIIRVFNQLGGPAAYTELSLLVELGADPLTELWSLYDGAELFIGPSLSGEGPAIRFYCCSEILDQTDVMRDVAIGGMDGLFDFQKKGLAFGEISRSGNYFVYHKGAVFYSDHDCVDSRPFARSFPLFLKRLAKNPAKFLYESGCYTRYSDGSTKTQWIPETYLPDVGSV